MPRILSVEDDQDFQQLIRYALRDQSCEIHCAFTGPEGRDMAVELRPDVILLDMMLPGFNGLELLKLLKQRAETRSIPVIVMTAYSADAQFLENDLLALGASAYLRKPVQFNKLLRLIRQVLASPAPPHRSK